MVSIIIPFYNDSYLIGETVRRATAGLNPDDFEIIIVNDGSTFNTPSLKREYKNVHIIGYKINKGVGHAFDYGVKQALGDVLVLMGSDVYLHERSWLSDALRALKHNENGITASTCVGIQQDEHGKITSQGIKRYGADILLRVTKDDLPENSPLRQKDEYTDILQAKWLDGKQYNLPYRIPSLLGACYVTTKDFYMKIGGWGWIKDRSSMTREESKWCGHLSWGGLEPMISLKTWFAGGECKVDPRWETSHVFGRGDHVKKVRATQGDKYWWNKLFIAHTLFEPEQAKALDSHLLKELNQNIARLRIRNNRNAILLEKKWNDKIKTRDYTVFAEMFGYNTVI